MKSLEIVREVLTDVFYKNKIRELPIPTKTSTPGLKFSLDGIPVEYGYKYSGLFDSLYYNFVVEKQIRSFMEKFDFLITQFGYSPTLISVPGILDIIEVYYEKEGSPSLRAMLERGFIELDAEIDGKYVLAKPEHYANP